MKEILLDMAALRILIVELKSLVEDAVAKKAPAELSSSRILDLHDECVKKWEEVLVKMRENNYFSIPKLKIGIICHEMTNAIYPFYVKMFSRNASGKIDLKKEKFDFMAIAFQADLGRGIKHLDILASYLNGKDTFSHDLLVRNALKSEIVFVDGKSLLIDLARQFNLNINFEGDENFFIGSDAELIRGVFVNIFKNASEAMATNLSVRFFRYHIVIDDNGKGLLNDGKSHPERLKEINQVMRISAGLNGDASASINLSKQDSHGFGMAASSQMISMYHAGVISLSEIIDDGNTLKGIRTEVFFRKDDAAFCLQVRKDLLTDLVNK